MSKNFGIVGIVASFVFACSFLAAIPAQADLFEFNQRGEGWKDVAAVTFSDRNDELDGWNADAWQSGNYFAYPTNATGSRNDASHYVWASKNQLPQGTEVAVRIDVFGKGINDLLTGIKIMGYSDSMESPVYNPESVSSTAMEALAVDAGQSATAYLFELEDVLAELANLELMINSSVLSEYVRYTVTLQVREAADGAVPEPATLAVFGLGLLGTGLAARRRNKK